jgi:ribosomal protein S15P/S13E
MPPRSAAAEVANEAKSQRKIKALIYGPPKHGKTVFLGSGVLDERTRPMAILDFEGGVLDVLEGLPGGPNGPDWYHIPISSWEDFNVAYERLQKNEEGFKSVAIDSLSEVHVFALMNLLDDPGIRRDAKDRDLIHQQDYGKAMVQMRRLTRSFRDLPLHVFYTAHHKEDVDSKEGLVKMVNLSGKLATEIPGMMSLVGYLALTQDDEGKTQRVLLLQNYAKIRTGVRTAWGIEAPDEISDPTVTNVLDALHYE